MSQRRVWLSKPGLINALGTGIDEVRTALFAGSTVGMVSEPGWLVDNRPTRIGRVRGSLPAIEGELKPYDCRNNRLLLAAAAQLENGITELIERYGPDRIAVVTGTSTSGILEGEQAILWRMTHNRFPEHFDYRHQEIGTSAFFLARHLGLSGPAYTISTACTSSAKALVTGRRLLLGGLCDAVIVGGADTICQLTVSGFGSLESVSPGLCNPMSINRDGINIGEGGVLFLMTLEPTGFALLGCGESSDAYHMSAPHPEGEGAEAAMRAALADAGIEPASIGYVNLHGTATQKNDEMESLSMQRLFGEGVLASSTKPMIGHTLGAAGAMEAAFCWMVANDYERRLPPHLWDGQRDPQLAPLHLVGQDDHLPEGCDYLMSNSYAFGGSNVSLVLGRVP